MPNKDVLRVWDTAVNLAANLKNKMFGYDTNGERFAGKNASGTMKYVSEDTLQALLAKANTFTAVNTWTQNMVTTANKLIGIDQVGGIKIQASNKIDIAEDFTNYGAVRDEALNVLDGNGIVLDVADTISDEVITDGDFSAAGNWTFSGDIAFNVNKATWTYSTGTGYIEQLNANLAEKLMNNQWYELTYTIANAAGTLTGEVDAVTAETAVSLDMTNGTHTVYWEADGGGVNFRLSFTGGSGSAFDIDDIELKTIYGGRFWPMGGMGSTLALSLKVGGDGTVEMAENERIGAYPNLLDPTGIAFDSTGNADLTHKITYNTDSDGECGLETIETGQTAGAVSVNLDFSNAHANSSGLAVRVFIIGTNADFSKGYGANYDAYYRVTGAGAVTQIGTEQTTGAQSDFSTVSTSVTATGAQIRVTCTGEAGETIDWAATIHYLRSTP